MLEYYMNQVARGLIAFGISICLLGIIRMFWSLSFGVSIAIILILGLFLSPLLSKVRIAHYFVVKYEAFLDKQIARFKK